MLAAVSRDESMLSGGIASGKWTGRGTVVVEPLARLTASGEWGSLPCSADHLKGCAEFARHYLNKPHTYTVVSADGRNATVNSAPTTLSECYGFSGVGKYSGAPISRSAIAASAADFFADSPPLKLLDDEEAVPIRKALANLVPRKLDSIRHLRLLALRLEGRDLIVVQRAFADFANMPGHGELKLIFAIGAMDQDGFHVIYWKENTEDEDQRILGAVRLRTGRDFLITTVSDPESQSFRVYGVRDGRLALVYSGGGSSC